jgi:hypothetical protein
MTNQVQIKRSDSSWSDPWGGCLGREKSGRFSFCEKLPTMFILISIFGLFLRFILDKCDTVYYIKGEERSFHKDENPPTFAKIPESKLNIDGRRNSRTCPPAAGPSQWKGGPKMTCAYRSTCPMKDPGAKIALKRDWRPVCDGKGGWTLKTRIGGIWVEWMKFPTLKKLTNYAHKNQIWAN